MGQLRKENRFLPGNLAMVSVCRDHLLMVIHYVILIPRTKTWLQKTDTAVDKRDSYEKES